MRLEIRPLANVGAEVLGVDMTAPIDPEMAEQLKSLWYAHGMLLFRNQDIDAEQQIEFSRVFGELERHPLEVTRSDEYPELFVLENGGERDGFNTAYYHDQPIVGRLDWHMDLHYTAKPNHGALLRAVTIADEDGQTGFGDLARAYEALAPATKKILGRIEVAYRFNMQRLDMRFVDKRGYRPGPHSPKKPSDIGFPEFADAIYPAVVVHPITGDSVLEIVEQFLDRVIDPEQAGMTDAEADVLLRELVAHIRQPEFHHFHSWSPGDVILWDNWRIMHCTTGTRPGIRRLINRTTITAGDVVLGRSLDAPARQESADDPRHASG